MTVLYFGLARDCVGVSSETFDIPDGLNVAGLWGLLIERHPKLGTVRGMSRVAVDMRYASDSDPVPDGSEVAIIPPVAGG